MAAAVARHAAEYRRAQAVMRSYESLLVSGSAFRKR